MKKKIRFEYFLQAAILFGFALYFTGTVVTGTVYRYVHERHVPMLLLSAAALMLLGIVKWRQAVTTVSRRMIFQNASASRQRDPPSGTHLPPNPFRINPVSKPVRPGGICRGSYRYAGCGRHKFTFFAVCLFRFPRRIERGVRSSHYGSSTPACTGRANHHG